jgi:hypothetical protein
MRKVALSAALLLPLLLTLGLAGCGSDGGSDDVASDSAPTSATSSTSTPTPTAAPTAGSYPEFAPTDYTYPLGVGCFCMDSGSPMTVTVADGQVVKAVYGQDATGRGSAQAGEAVDHRYWKTINDVIAETNNPKADHVTVDWPAGQDYPNQVSVDPNRETTDDEIFYTISDVQVAG